MKTALLFFISAFVAIRASAADFARGASFDSVSAFVDAAKFFQPSLSKSDFSWLFTVRELGQFDDPELGIPVVASAIKSAAPLWSDDVRAFVFITAMPPTSATRSAVGVLFFLTHEKDSWRVTDVLRFCATGKEAEVSAELTAEVGTGYHLGSEGTDPVVTIKVFQGGRGYSYQLSASYTFDALKLKRLELDWPRPVFAPLHLLHHDDDALRSINHRTTPAAHVYKSDAIIAQVRADNDATLWSLKAHT